MWVATCSWICRSSDATSPAQPFSLVLELGQRGGFGFDRVVAKQDFLLDLRLGGVVVRDLVLEGLVFVVLLDLIELDLEVVDLGIDALERMLVFLQLDLGVLQCLSGGFQFGLAVGESGLARRQGFWPGSQPVAERRARWCRRWRSRKLSAVAGMVHGPRFRR